MTTVTKTDLKTDILNILRWHVGRGNPIKASELAGRLECSKSNTWIIREAIAELIKDGFPVCSTTTSPEGYFLASSWLEVDECAQSLRDRGIKVIIRRRDLRRAANKYFNGYEQQRLL